MQQTEDVSGLKSALEKTRVKLQSRNEKIAALEEDVARLKEAFDKLTQAIALRNGKEC